MNGIETVYVVEGDQSTRQAQCELVADGQRRVVSCATAEEFVEAYRPNGPSCLLLEERLPGMAGTELLERLRLEGREIPAVFLTACADTPVTVRAMKLGAVNVFNKPCDDEVLLTAVGEALQQDTRRIHHDTLAKMGRARLEQLSEGERQVLMLVLEGIPNKRIAAELGVSVRTVETRRSRIYQAVGVDSVAKLVRMCVLAGVIEP